MRGLTDEDAWVLAMVVSGRLTSPEAPGEEVHCFYPEPGPISARLAEAGRIAHRECWCSGEPGIRPHATPLGLLALQLWKAGIK